MNAAFGFLALFFFAVFFAAFFAFLAICSPLSVQACPAEALGEGGDYRRELSRCCSNDRLFEKNGNTLSSSRCGMRLP